VLTVVACTGGDDDVAPSTTLGSATTTTIATRADDGVLSIGIYLPRTGDGAQLGVPMIAAAQDAIESINRAGGVLGHAIEVEIADEGAGTGPNQLLSLGVDAIIGPASSTVALSQLRNVIDETNGVVTCSPTATAKALDAYPDGGFFFRTVPSDSLQMRAIGRRAQRTGAETVAVAYLDDPYGRGLAESFVDDVEGRPLEVVAQEGFGLFGQDDLSGTAAALLADNPGVIVVLGDAGDGSRLLAALDAATDNPPQIIINDSIRSAVPAIRELSDRFRANLTGVAPLARSQTAEGPDGFFTAHAVDCVNLIALAAVTADSDVPNLIRRNMAAVSTGGRECTSFEACEVLIERGLQIDYDGLSGSVNLSTTTGDPDSATFIAFGFDASGAEVNTTRFDVSN
jgi:branched-chain amino acid transport system substrate-binding protein